jgi:hypothetical protein
MGTLGVVLAEGGGGGGGVDDLFGWATRLEGLWDRLDGVEGEVFDGDEGMRRGKEVMDEYWRECGDQEEGEAAQGGGRSSRGEDVRLRELVSGGEDPLVSSLLVLH